MKLASAGASDQGKRRPNNEDSFLVNDGLGLFAVADGVGGREGGEIASSAAVDTLAEALPDLLGRSDRTPPAGMGPGDDREAAALRTAVRLAGRRIIETVGERPDLAGMGTTLTALLVTPSGARLCHVGDSRAYLLRSGKLLQLTDDHSVVAEQARAGLITRKQARTSPLRHVITRALGTNGDVEPDLLIQDVRKNDLFLLCTDGLTEMVEDREIGAILSSSAPDAAVRKLIKAANAAGGVDNITAVVVKVQEV